MPYLHAARFLDEAIQSVASQTYERWELLLVDDGSTDGSERIAASWARRQPGRIHCLRHPGGANRGISASRNLGLRSASGELVAFLDADDVWRENKLERHVALLSAHPEAGMVYGRTEYWHSWTGDRGDAVRDHVPSHGRFADVLVAPPVLVTAFLRGTTSVPCICSVLVRRALLERLGGFEETFPGLYEDQVLYAKVCLVARVFVSDECLERYRQHPDSLCAVAERTGAEGRDRRRYLLWLRDHVARSGVDDCALARALRGQLWIHGGAEPVRLPRWARRLVRVAKGAAVRLAGLVPCRARPGRPPVLRDRRGRRTPT
jgi:glycosyltransferase involved in cell wall biosynthesis